MPSGFGISPELGGFLTHPGEPERGPEWEVVEPGWGQLASNIVVEWGGPTHEFEVRIAEAPVIYERFDHPNRQRPKNHGGHGQ